MTGWKRVIDSEGYEHAGFNKKELGRFFDANISRPTYALMSLIVKEKPPSFRRPDFDVLSVF